MKIFNKSNYGIILNKVNTDRTYISALQDYPIYYLNIYENKNNEFKFVYFCIRYEIAWSHIYFGQFILHNQKEINLIKNLSKILNNEEI